MDKFSTDNLPLSLSRPKIEELMFYERGYLLRLSDRLDRHKSIGEMISFSNMMLPLSGLIFSDGERFTVLGMGLLNAKMIRCSISSWVSSMVSIAVFKVSRLIMSLTKVRICC